MAATIYARPVIPLLVAFMGGIAAGLHISGLNGWADLTAAAGAVAILFGIFRNKKTAAAPLILFFALGHLAIGAWAAPDFPADHVIRFADSYLGNITGTIDSRPAAYPERVRFVLKVEAVEAEILRPATGRIMVSVWGESPVLSRGDRISFAGTIKPFRNFNNPGRFDYKRHMNFRKIWGAANVQSKVIRTLEKDAAARRLDMQAARDRIAGLIQATGEGEHQGVLQALIVGERSLISEETTDAFNRAGVSHLLAISGLHVGIVAVAAFAFFKWLLQWVRPLLWRAWTRKGAALLTLLPVITYGLLAGMSPSTQRAVIMVAAFLLSFLLEADQDLINTLALAAMAILAVYPPALFSASFQLSFSAVFFIVCGMAALAGVHLKTVVFDKLFGFVLVSFFAVMGTLPLVMRYFNQVSLVALLSNIVLIPLVGFVVVPLGLTAAFISPISPDGALWGFKLAAAILKPSLEIIAFFAGLPFAAVKTVTPNLVEIACYYGLAGVLFSWRFRRFKEAGGSSGCLFIKRMPHSQERQPGAGAAGSPGGPEVFPRRIFVKRHPAAALAIILLLAAGADAVYCYYQRFLHPALRATVIDVGQGSATLLQLPKGYNVLIDGGGFSDNSGFDVGAQVVAPFLWRQRIRTVHNLILSHPNSDHLNGLLYIAEHFNVQTVWTNGQPAAVQSYRQFLETIAKKEIRMPAFAALPRTSEINGVRLDILYPLPGFMEKTAQEKWRDLNNNSLVVQVRFGAKTILIPGDIMAPAEAELVSAAGAALASDVLLAPHHGSAKSNSDPFLDAVSPETVIFSNGWKNRFKFPHEWVVEKYRRHGCRIIRTDTHGAVFITIDGKKMNIRPFLMDAQSPSVAR